MFSLRDMRFYFHYFPDLATYGSNSKVRGKWLLYKKIKKK